MEIKALVSKMRDIYSTLICFIGETDYDSDEYAYNVKEDPISVKSAIINVYPQQFDGDGDQSINCYFTDDTIMTLATKLAIKNNILFFAQVCLR